MCDTLNGFHFKKTLWECHNVTARVQQGAINFLLPSLIIFIDDIFFSSIRKPLCQQSCAISQINVFFNCRRLQSVSLPLYVVLCWTLCFL